MKQDSYGNTQREVGKGERKEGGTEHAHIIWKMVRSQNKCFNLLSLSFFSNKLQVFLQIPHNFTDKISVTLWLKGKEFQHFVLLLKTSKVFCHMLDLQYWMCPFTSIKLHASGFLPPIGSANMKTFNVMTLRPWDHSIIKHLFHMIIKPVPIHWFFTILLSIQLFTSLCTDVSMNSVISTSTLLPTHWFNHPSIHQSIHLSSHALIHPSNYPSTYPSNFSQSYSRHPSRNLYIHPSFHQFTYLSPNAFIYHPFIYLFIHPSIHPFIQPAIHLPIHLIFC